MNKFFKTQNYGVSIARLWLMRALFAITGLLFGVPTLIAIFEDWGTYEPLEGVAYAFWGALGVLALIGVRYPLSMLPVLLIQFFYKMIWLLAVGYPLLNAGPLDEYASSMMDAMRTGVLLDIIVIPWVFVFKQYIANFFRVGKV